MQLPVIIKCHDVTGGSLIYVCISVFCMHLCLLCGSSENVAYILYTNCKLVSEFQEVQSSDVQVKHESTIRDMPAELGLHIIALRDTFFLFAE